MRTVTLTRQYLPEYTCGILAIDDGGTTFRTLELPYRDNKKNISCIPAGEYICRKVCSPKFGDTFEICDVHGRGNILFHYGNYVENTQGCVLLGERWANGMLQDTRLAMQQFMNIFKDEFEFKLIIKAEYDGAEL